MKYIYNETKRHHTTRHDKKKTSKIASTKKIITYTRSALRHDVRQRPRHNEAAIVKVQHPVVRNATIFPELWVSELWVALLRVCDTWANAVVIWSRFRFRLRARV